jgi:uncharacterized protein (DUF1501 family)
MERRNFLKNILPLAAIPLVSDKLFANVLNPASISQEALAMIAGDIDRVLVLVRMDGGNDGLNTVIPLDQYEKLINPKVRKDLMTPLNQILSLKNTTTLGLHPSLGAFQKIYNDDQLSIIQGVANTAGVFSHFHGIDQWETASDKQNTYYSGWIGRYLEKTYHLASTNYPNTCMPDPLAIEVGAGTFLGRGTGAILSQKISPGFNGSLTELVENYTNDDLSVNMKEELTFLRAQQGFTNDYGKKIVAAWKKGRNSSITYPNSVVPKSHPTIKPTNLAQQLKIVARLIHGGLKTRIFVVSIGNFDTHTKQVSTSWHSLLLKDLGDAIGAFQNDINQLGIGDRIVGMTYSEFGRRVVQNGDGGTEHGLAAPMFVFGNKVRGGVIGNNYIINDVNTINSSSNVPIQYDYRQVYNTVLTDWFGVCKSDAIDIIKKDVQPVANVFKAGVNLSPCLMGSLVNPLSTECKNIVNVVEITGDDHDLYARIQPNPSNGAFKVVPVAGFNYDKNINVKIMDMQGKLVYNNSLIVSENEEIQLDVLLQPQMYILSLANDNKVLHQKIVIAK